MMTMMTTTPGTSNQAHLTLVSRRQSPIDSGRLELVSRSPSQTQSIGRVLGEHAGPGDVILLAGTLGTGKTCLAQGILWGLGSDEYARSPTFVLVSQYSGRLTMYHMDLYRLSSLEELSDLGLDEYLFGDGVCVVEWAQKAYEAFPPQRLTVELSYLDETTRGLTFTGQVERFRAGLEAVRASSEDR